jgi:hypothetical protein
MVGEIKFTVSYMYFITLLNNILGINKTTSVKSFKPVVWFSMIASLSCHSRLKVLPKPPITLVILQSPTLIL